MEQLSNKEKNNAFFRQLLFIAILIVIGLIIFKQLRFFLGAFLGATTIYVVFRGWMFKLTEKFHWRRWVASLTLVSAIALLLSGLGYLIFEMVASEIPNVDTSMISQGIDNLIKQVNEWTGMNLIPSDILNKSGDFITKAASGLATNTYSAAVNVFLMLVILYFMLAQGRRMECKILAYSPFSGKGLELIEQEFHNMVFSNAVGIPIIMISQGLTACLVYWILGINNVLFWAFLTALCGLIPMIGTSLVTVPLGIYMMATGELWQGIVLIICGLLVIANADNVTRILLMKRVANTHPLIIIFGVILGIPFFGFWGIIFGPLLISGFILLLRIYFREYQLINTAALETYPVPKQTKRTKRQEKIHNFLSGGRGHKKSTAYAMAKTEKPAETEPIEKKKPGPKKTTPPTRRPANRPTARTEAKKDHPAKQSPKEATGNPAPKPRRAPNHTPKKEHKPKEE